jgi:hypothetical protein
MLCEGSYSKQSSNIACRTVNAPGAPEQRDGNDYNWLHLALNILQHKVIEKKKEKQRLETGFAMD